MDKIYEGCIVLDEAKVNQNSADCCELSVQRRLCSYNTCFLQRGQGYGPGYGETDLKSTPPPPVTKTTLKTTSPPKTLGQYFLPSSVASIPRERS